MIKSIQNEKANAILMNVLTWRENHISERTFLLILAFVIGLLSGFAALLLKFLISLIASTLSEHLTISGANYLYLVYPVIGILIVGIYVRYIVRDNISHGVTRVLHAISQNKSRLKLHDVRISSCQFHNNRIRWFRRSRRSYRRYRSSNRLQPWQSFPNVATDIDDACWQRCCSRRCWHF